jgi:hypothetical protein
MEKFWALIVAEVFTKREAWTPHWSYQEVALRRDYHGGDQKPRCRASVAEGGRSVMFHQCSKAGKVQLADGSWWCAAHSPVALKARKDVSDAKMAAFMARIDANTASQRARANMERAFPTLVDALNQIAAGHNDPRSLAREALGEFLKEP